jgi:FixJ family two-component response regulator
VAGTKTLVTVVDDDLSISRMLSRVLMSEGFEVESYTSAEDFLKSGLLSESECLILDISLPGMTGVELQQQLLEKGSNVPIVFMSADADEHVQRRVRTAGAVGFLRKPFSLDSLLTLVRSVALPALT